MYHYNFLTNKLLIASPLVQNNLFHQSIIFLYEQTKEKSIGFVINKPSILKLCELLEKNGIFSHSFSYPKQSTVLIGGPVFSNEIFMMYPEKDKKNIFDLHLLPPEEALIRLDDNTIPENLFFFSGYTTWKNHQLEHELTENYWIVSDLYEELFYLPYKERWNAANALNGIPINRLIINQAKRAYS